MHALHGLVLDAADQIDSGEAKDTGDVLNLTTSLKNLVAIQKGNDENKKREREERQAAIAVAEKAAKSGASGEQVAEVIRKALIG
jgi:hypothetical protein